MHGWGRKHATDKKGVTADVRTCRTIAFAQFAVVALQAKLLLVCFLYKFPGRARKYVMLFIGLLPEKLPERARRVVMFPCCLTNTSYTSGFSDTGQQSTS